MPKLSNSDARVDFRAIGVPVSHAGVPAEAKEYLTARGHTAAALKRAAVRWIDDATTASMFPASARGAIRPGGVTVLGDEKACWAPRGAILLPWPSGDYALARPFYDVADVGESNGPPKYLTPSGEPTHAYFPPMAKPSALADAATPLLIVEGPLKALVAASRGLVAIGVNGCFGTKDPGAMLPAKPTRDDARRYIRDELHDLLLAGREVALLVDADARSNLNVRHALIDFMRAAGIGFDAQPVFVEMPDLGDGKTGLDDFLASGKTARDVLALPRHGLDSHTVRELRAALCELTEIGLADRLVLHHGHHLRHDPSADAWFAFDPATGWRRDEVVALQAMRSTVETLPAETVAEKSDAARKARAKFATSAASDRTMRAALRIAGLDPAITTDSVIFDADSDLLGVENGILRLSDGALLPFAPEHRVTMRAGCAFDPKAKAQRWRGFVETVARGDRAMTAYLQEIAGACLAGRASRAEVFFLYGPGGNGKSVFLETLTATLGDYAVTIPARVLLRSRRDADAERSTPFLVKLVGKRLALCSELPENVALDEATVKDLAGGDTITARENFKAPVTFKNTARVIVRANHLPSVSGTDAGIWDRVRVVPFEHKFDEREADPYFAAKIAEHELPGVLAWAVAGYQRLAARGFKFETPAAVRERTAKHRADSDVLGAWLDECVEINSTERETPWRELQREVTGSYLDWCKANNHQPLAAKNLWAKLRERLGYEPVVSTNGAKWVTGMQLRRGPIGASIVANLQAEVDVLTDQLRATNAPAEPTDGSASTTRSGKAPMFVIKGGRK